MAVKSESALELYADYVKRIREAVEQAIAEGDSVAAIAQRIGANRHSVNAIRNGTYESILNSSLLIAFDIEFDLGIFKK